MALHLWCLYIYFFWWRILPKPLLQQLLASRRHAKTSIYISTEICLQRSKWWAPMHVCRKFSCTLLINQLKDMFMFYQKKKISFLNSDPVVSASPSEKKLSCETKLTFYKLSYLKISITRSSNLHLKMLRPPSASKSFFLWWE